MSLKVMVFGFAAAGVGGLAMTGDFAGGHDAERLVAKSPAAVYAALSAMAPEVTRVIPAENDGPPMTLEVRKDAGKAVHFALSVEGRTIGSVDLSVTPDQGGAASRLAADVELDQAALAKRFGDPDATGEWVPAPEALVNLTVGQMLGELARDIEAGKSLKMFDSGDLAGLRSRMGNSGPGGEMREEMRDTAPAPMKAQPFGSTKPMVDPNAEARKNINGGR
ncbi:MAG TPA: hypothetical protein VE053_15060 [Allosphingosinicella sp.]|nr:hypothetical protein [Allosphingosinicella sp.]